ncbi:hypothetical protein ACFLZN_00835 [Nanoarchaeota archaeon]
MDGHRELVDRQLEEFCVQMNRGCYLNKGGLRELKRSSRGNCENYELAKGHFQHWNEHYYEIKSRIKDLFRLQYGLALDYPEEFVLNWLENINRQRIADDQELPAMVQTQLGELCVSLTRGLYLRDSGLRELQKITFPNRRKVYQLAKKQYEKLKPEFSTMDRRINNILRLQYDLTLN